MSGSAVEIRVVRRVPEDSVTVLLEEEVGLAERRHAGGLGDVLDPEARLVRVLTRDQVLAVDLAGLARLAVGLAVGHRGAIGVAVEDRDAVVLVGRWTGAAGRAVEGVEEAAVRRVRDEDLVAGPAPVGL